jgi:hypothetical protein
MSQNCIGEARPESTVERYEPQTPTQQEAGDACTVSILARDAERAS